MFKGTLVANNLTAITYWPTQRILLMKRMSYYLTLVVLITISSTGFAGNSSGGGGGVLYGKAKPVLVDLLNIDPDFEDTDAHLKWNSSRLDQSPSKIGLTRNNESQVRAGNSAFDLALTIIEKWETKFLDITAGTIHTAFMLPLNWTYTEKELSAAESYLPLPTILRENIKTAAYYDKNDRNYSVQISRKIWNELGIISQAGLLVHETFRHLQIGWSNQFDEESLQKATALIMMCEPHSSINLYLFYVTQNRSDLATLLVGNFDDVIKKYCKRVL